MSIISSHNYIVKKLVEDGIVLPQCRRFEVVVEATKPVILRQETYVTEEQFKRLMQLVEGSHDMQTTVFTLGKKDEVTDITALGSEAEELLRSWKQ